MNNRYINTSKNIQKGGIWGSSGCLKHTGVLSQLIWEAKKSKGNLTVVWLDLTNAYGLTPHSLINTTISSGEWSPATLEESNYGSWLPTLGSQNGEAEEDRGFRPTGKFKAWLYEWFVAKADVTTDDLKSPHVISGSIWEAYEQTPPQWLYIRSGQLPLPLYSVTEEF